MPWCYGLHARDAGNAGNVDDEFSDAMGCLQRPDQAQLREWADYVGEALEEGWQLNGGFSPARSVYVMWPGTADIFSSYNADVGVNNFDLNMDIEKARYDLEVADVLPLRQSVMTKWSEDHGQYQGMCWQRCCDLIKPRPDDPDSQDALRRATFLEFMCSELQAYADACDRADQWWQAFENLLSCRCGYGGNTRPRELTQTIQTPRRTRRRMDIVEL